MILDRLFIASGDESFAEAGGKEISVLTATWESVAVPALCLGLSLGFRRHDPFFLASQFPWLWLAPLLVALRHGSLGGIIASLTMVAGWSLAGVVTPMLHMEFPRAFFLGGMLTTFVCGEFRDLWQAENRRQRKARHLLSIHLDELASAHHILAQSHDKLALDFIAHPPTLRDALAEIPMPSHGRLDAQAAQALLDFLSRHFQLDIAAIHLMEPSGLNSKPLASLGPCRHLDGKETLVRTCLQDRGLCHVDGSSSEQEPYLVAAPLVVHKGGVLGILAVEKMPFFAFQEDNLRNLFSILCYYSDALVSANQVEPLVSRIPHCPIPFAKEYLRLHRLKQEADLPSVLACRVSAPKTGDSLLAPLPATPTPASIGARAVDHIWLRTLSDGRQACFALLPLVTQAQASLTLARWHFPAGQDWVRLLSEGDPIEAFQHFLHEIDPPDAAMTVTHGAGAV
jgi:polysaccharide biosynthesis protein PelD